MAAVWEEELPEPRNTGEKVRARTQSSHHLQSGQAPHGTALASQCSPGLRGNPGTLLNREVEVLPGPCLLGVSFNKVTNNPSPTLYSVFEIAQEVSLIVLPAKQGLPRFQVF